MNKLLTVVLILAIVSVASAGLTWKVDGTALDSVVVSAGDTINIELWADFDVSGLSIPLIGDGTAGGTATSGWIHPDFDAVGDPGFDCFFIEPFSNCGTIEYVLGTVNPPGYPTGKIWSMNYIVPFSGSIPFFIEDIPGEGLVAECFDSSGNSVAVPAFSLITPSGCACWGDVPTDIAGDPHGPGNGFANKVDLINMLSYLNEYGVGPGPTVSATLSFPPGAPNPNYNECLDMDPGGPNGFVNKVDLINLLTYLNANGSGPGKVVTCPGPTP